LPVRIACLQILVPVDQLNVHVLLGDYGRGTLTYAILRVLYPYGMTVCGECQVLFPIIWLSDDDLRREIIVYPYYRLLIQLDDVSVPRGLPPDEGLGTQEG
jgi:hypothetical protein